MKAPVFPVFTLQTKNKYVIIGGGGGNKEFGKTNGIIILAETTYKDIAFVETEDIILDIIVCELEEDTNQSIIVNKKEDIFSDKKNGRGIEDDYKIVGDEEIQKFTPLDSPINIEEYATSEDESQNSSTEKAAFISSEEDNLKFENSEENNEMNSKCQSSKSMQSENLSQRISEVIENSTMKNEEMSSVLVSEVCLYLICTGTNFLYLIKFENNKLEVIKRIEKYVAVQYYDSDYYCISNKKVFAIRDIIHCPDNLDALLVSTPATRSTSKKGVLNDTDQEEYVYTIVKEQGRILIKREEGNTDIPETWINFFIYKDRIYKVTKEEDKSVFIFNSKKYMFDNEIGSIKCSDTGLLIFYLKGIKSTLHFIKDKETTYEIPKITCMTLIDDYVVIGTGEGIGYLYSEDKLIYKKKLCDIAITGISYNDGFFYFSSFNGLVDRKYAGINIPSILLFAVLLMAVAVLVGVYLKIN